MMPGIGHKLEDALMTGLPHDELFVYEEALRRGRIVVIVQVESDHDAEIVRAALDAAGAESIDAAREACWVGLRDEDADAYRESGGDFAADESRRRPEDRAA